MDYSDCEQVQAEPNDGVHHAPVPNILFSPVGDTDNPAAIRRVADLARQNGAKLTLFGAVPEASRRHRLLYGEATMRGSAFASTPTEVIERYLRTEHDDRLQAVTDLIAASPVSDAPWRIQLVKGRPGTVVRELVTPSHQLAGDGHGRPQRNSGLVMGNTAEQVLEEVPCSVIDVKPPGFTSPVVLRQ